MKELIIKIFYTIGSFFINKWPLNIYESDVAILMYHRVLPDEEDLKEKATISVGTSRFEEHIKHLSENYSCIHIDDLANVKNMNLDKKPVVVTIDDGYKDNLLYALPILERYNVPAIIYVTTSFPEGDCSLWWYELAEILDKLKEIKFQGSSYQLDNHKKRIICYKAIHAVMMSSDLTNQKKIMREIRSDMPEINYSSLVLSWNEIIELDKNPLITIGAHTHTHAVLSSLSEHDMKADILKSKELLEKNLSHPVDHFCYPAGGRAHASYREYRAVKELGFKTGVTTIYGKLSLDKESFYNLPRIATKKRTTASDLDVKISGWNSLFNGVQI